MKGILIASGSIFLIASTFRLLHWPFASILVILSFLLILIFAVVNSFSKKEIWKIDIFGGWIINSWALYILFRYLYWYCGPSIFGFNAMFLVILILTIIYLSSKKSNAISKTLITISLIGLVFSFIPSYSICYFFDLNEIINKENNNTNYYSWDKYSWFLYIRGEKKRALDANQKAIKAWKNMDKMNGGPHSEFTDIPLILLNHERAIIHENWTDGYIKMH
jgi:hypothetical protein